MKTRKINLGWGKEVIDEDDKFAICKGKILKKFKYMDIKKYEWNVCCTDCEGQQRTYLISDDSVYYCNRFLSYSDIDKYFNNELKIKWNMMWC